MAKGEAVRWVLNCSANDLNVKNAILRLTDEELCYCIEHEKRRSGRDNLLREMRKREKEFLNIGS